jgi:hypothetical protein
MIGRLARVLVGGAIVTCIVTQLAAAQRADARTSEPANRRGGASRIAQLASRIPDSLLALMSLDEKLGQLTDVPAGYGQTGPTVDAGGERDVRAGKVGAFLSLYGADVTRKMQRIAVEESRLHIPLVFGHETSDTEARGDDRAGNRHVAAHVGQ